MPFSVKYNTFFKDFNLQLYKELYFLLVCNDVTVRTQYDGQSVKWKLGHCHNARQYQDYREYIQRCCLIPGKYTLTCINSDNPEGWKNGRLTFQGVDFCYDFMAFKVFRQIIVEGNYIFRPFYLDGKS